MYRSRFLTLLSCLLLSSCSLIETNQLHDQVKDIKIYDSFEHIKNVTQCQFIDELVGSEGTWYSYWFINNKELTLGSINDLKNQANKLGANVIHIQYHLPFTTSVTFLAQAYDCPE